MVLLLKRIVVFERIAMLIFATRNKEVTWLSSIGRTIGTIRIDSETIRRDNV